MNILGIDFETTGLDPEQDRIVEVGIVLWDVERRCPVRVLGYLVKPNDPIPAEKWAEVTPLNGIDERLVMEHGREEAASLQQVLAWADLAEMMVAFNGTDFDRLFLQNWIARMTDAYGRPLWRSIRNGLLPPWIDTRIDVPTPMTGSLLCIAAKQGFLNPFPHRAVADVLTMMRILDSYDFPAVVERAKIPNVTVQALVSFDDKEKAKVRGYYWKSDSKQWLKLIKECDVEKENDECDFRIAVLRP